MADAPQEPNKFLYYLLMPIYKLVGFFLNTTTDWWTKLLE